MRWFLAFAAAALLLALAVEAAPASADADSVKTDKRLLDLLKKLQQQLNERRDDQLDHDAEERETRETKGSAPDDERDSVPGAERDSVPGAEDERDSVPGAERDSVPGAEDERDSVPGAERDSVPGADRLETKHGLTGATKDRVPGADRLETKDGVAAATKDQRHASDDQGAILVHMTKLVIELLNGCLNLSTSQGGKGNGKERAAGDEAPPASDGSKPEGNPTIRDMIKTVVELQYNLIAYDLIGMHQKGTQGQSPESKLGVAHVLRRNRRVDEHTVDLGRLLKDD